MLHFVYMRLVYNKSLEKLIEGCVKGNRDSQRRVYEQYAPKMMSVCLRFMKNREEAEDVLQEGFVKVFRKVNTYSGSGSFEGWMRTIFVNTALRKLENRKRDIDQVHLDNEVHHSASVEAEMMHALEYKELLKLVNSMPDGYRIVFNMYAIEGYTHREIAEKLQISEGTSKSQLARARAYLKKRVIALYQDQKGFESGQTAG